MEGLMSAGYFLISSLFSIILLVLWLRVFIRYFKINPFHPIAQSIYNLTNPVIQLIEPAFKKIRIAQLDISALILIIAVETIKFILLGFVLTNKLLPFSYLILFVLTDLIIEPLNLLFYALLFRIIFSWITINIQLQPIADFVSIITAPLVRFGYKIIPNISGYDFSPLLMLILIKVITLAISGQMPLPLL